MEHRAIPGDFTVLMDPFATASERFAILRIDELLPQNARLSSVEETVIVFQQMFRTLTWLTEADLRQRLADMGLPAIAIEARVDSARRKMAVATSGPTVYERITRIGYRNGDGQEVIDRTDVWGAAGQRVFAMRCGVCGHDYGSYGCDIDIRRCPACQDGPAGLPTH
jgi:hypothetical protein